MWWKSMRIGYVLQYERKDMKRLQPCFQGVGKLRRCSCLLFARFHPVGVDIQVTFVGEDTLGCCRMVGY